jgi:YHS domain-containing protein
MASDVSDSTIEPAKTACGGKLRRTEGFPSTIYGGEQIHFCSQACFRVFEQRPDDFMAGKIKHPLEQDLRLSLNHFYQSGRLWNDPEPA